MNKSNAIVNKSLDTTVEHWWNPKVVDGEVGIEIECEGNNLVRAVKKYWKVIEDHSLRGESAEYVLGKPIKRNLVSEALGVLSKDLFDNGSQVNESYRTSVHVHINNQGLKFRHIFNYLCMYMIFEEYLVDFCGKDRIGNLFCLRFKDAEGLLDTLVYAIKRGDYLHFHNDANFKYAAVNISALGNYGSLEFRSFRGTVDPGIINAWVSMLLEMKDKAQTYNNPQEIIGEFSKVGPKGFLEATFSPENQRRLTQGGFEPQRIINGMHYAQEIAFAIPDWSEYKEPDKKEKPPKEDLYGAPPVHFDELLGRIPVPKVGRNRYQALDQNAGNALDRQWIINVDNPPFPEEDL